MQEVRSIKNQYSGINAHLQSGYQNGGGWNSFHHNHIGYLAQTLLVLLAVLKAHQAGKNLEAGPLPLDDINLDTARDELKTWLDA